MIATAMRGFPNPLSSFIGRERKVVEVGQLLCAHRLVTLTGAGGVGKTQLALRVAGDVAERFADGIVFVPLAPITNPALVTSSIAQLVGLQDAGGRGLVAILEQTLRERQFLLILDHFEQVLSAAPLIAGLRSHCPQRRMLVT